MLSVITYNTHLFDGVGLGFLPTFEDETRRANLINFLNSDQVQADVVGLTEVWPSNSKDTILQQLRSKYPFSHYYDSSSLNVGDGLLLLSKRFLGDKKFEAFTDSAGDDSFSQKGILSAKITIDGVHTRLFLTHTQAAEDEDDKAARAGNIRQISDFIRRTVTNTHEAIVLMGDLNVIAEQPNGAPTSEYATVLVPLMQEVGLHDVYRTLNLSGSSQPGFTFDGNRNALVGEFAPEERGVRQRLDYIFSSGQSLSADVQTPSYHSPERGSSTDLSDHYLLHGEIDVLKNDRKVTAGSSKYTVVIETVNDGTFGNAGTDSDIYLKMWGENGLAMDEIRLNGLLGGDIFERGDIDTFSIERGGLGVVTKLRLRSAGNDDWQPRSVKVKNPNGEQTIFIFGNEINKSSSESEITRTAQGYPKPVNISAARKRPKRQRQIYTKTNLSNEAQSDTVTVSIQEDDQIQISETQLRGTQVPTGAPFLSAKNRMAELGSEAKEAWEEALSEKRVEPETHELEISETQALELPAKSLAFVEASWDSPEEEGVAQWGDRKYGVRWLAEKPQLTEANTIIFEKGSEEKIPYRFKHHLIQTDNQQALAEFDGQFMATPAIRLDGANDFARTGAMLQAMPEKAFSFGCWASPADTNNPDGTLMAFNTQVGGNLNMIGFDAVKKNFFYFDPENSYRWSGGEVQFDQWYHVMVSVDEEKQGILYVNGEPTVRFSTNIHPGSHGRFSLGQEWDDDTPSDFFKGRIADAQVWNRAFTAQEARSLRSKRLQGKESQLIAYWPMKEERGEVLHELVKGNNANLIGGQWEMNTDLPLD